MCINKESKKCNREGSPNTPRFPRPAVAFSQSHAPRPCAVVRLLYLYNYCSITTLTLPLFNLYETERRKYSRCAYCCPRHKCTADDHHACSHQVRRRRRAHVGVRAPAASPSARTGSADRPNFAGLACRACRACRWLEGALPLPPPAC